MLISKTSWRFEELNDRWYNKAALKSKHFYWTFSPLFWTKACPDGPLGWCRYLPLHGICPPCHSQRMVYIFLLFLDNSRTPFAFFLGLVGLYTLAVISIDRFLAIKCKFTYSTIVNVRRLRYVLIPCWVINGSLYIIGVLFLEKIPRTALSVFIALYTAVLLCIITLFYSMAFYYLKKVSSQVSTGHTNPPALHQTFMSTNTEDLYTPCS